MKFKKTIIASVAALALTGFITGCGDEKKAAAPAPKDSKAVTLKVGVSPVPHAEILGAVKGGFKNPAEARAKSTLALFCGAQNLSVGVEHEHLAVGAVEPERKFAVARF